VKNKFVSMWVAFAVTAIAGSMQVASAQTEPAAKASSGNDALQEVIVTAQRRQEDLQKVPIAVTSLSIQDLAGSNINSVQDVATLVSGFIGPGDNGMQSPHLRGIGSQVGSPGIENSVALYVDGTYIGATTPALFGLSYVQQVDVLKGPQGTLFGRNTTGGLVQITTWDPSGKAEAEGEIGYANYSKVSGSAYFNAPLSSDVSTNLAIAASDQGNGWGTNKLSGKDVYRTDLNLTARNKWKIRFGDATELKIVADYEKINETGTFAYRPETGLTTYVGPPPFLLPPGSLPPPGTYYTSTLTGWDVNSNSDQESNTKAYGLSARLSHDFGYATLSNALAYRRSQFDLLHFDADKTPLDYFTVDWYNDNKQVTDELQLVSNGSGRVNWTLGAFFYHAVDDTHQFINWGALAPVLPGPPITPPIGQLLLVETKDAITSESYAGYAQADFKIASATTLTAGLRYSHDSHELAGYSNTTGTGGFFPAPPASDSFSKSAVSARLALSQQLSADAMIYASFNHGVKAGGYNPVVVDNAPYDDEKLDTFELGSKLTFLDNRARLNLAGFYNKYKNIQVQKFQAGGPPLIYNGPAAKSYGVDVDFELRPVANFKVRGTLESLHSEFTDFPLADILIPQVFGVPGNTLTAGFIDTQGSATGNPLPDAPKFTASLVPTWTIPAGQSSYELSATWSYNSGFTTTPGMEIEQPAFNLLGASLQFIGPEKRYYVKLWGSNLTNKEVAMNLTLSSNGTYVGLLAPRTFGITLGRSFL
jgi:iron complex outermembrane recepter protein